jgi:hypothetical protein
LKTRLLLIYFPGVTNSLLGESAMRVPISGACLCLLIALVGPLHAQVPSYTKDVHPFLNKYCVECHQGNKSKGGVNLESYESLMKGGKKGRQLLVPGQSDKSPLVMTVEGKGSRKMPPKKASAQPTADEIGVLRAWVEGGAKDDTPKKSSWNGGAEKNFRTSTLAMAESPFLPSGLLGFERLQSLGGTFGYLAWHCTHELFALR